MSMPELPISDPDLTQQALIMILSSIALEELAFRRIADAEGEKIQYTLSRDGGDASPADIKDMPAINKNEQGILETILQKQIVLENKLEKVLEHLPKSTSQTDLQKPPVTPPEKSLPSPQTPCYAPGECCPLEQSFCFDAIPRKYCHGEHLQWKENNIWGRFAPMPGNCQSILMPRTGTFAIDLYLDVGSSTCPPGEVILSVCCKDKSPIVKRLRLERQSYGCFLHKRTVIQMPCPCYPCYANVTVCAPDGLHVRQGGILFARL